MNTTPETPTKAPSDKVPAKRIQPLEGWAVQTAYGTLKTHAGDDLVRLEDVHTWMCRSGKPAADAVRSIFSPFYMACLSSVEDGDESALVLPGKLYVLNALTLPQALLTGSDRSKVESARVFAAGFPDLGHVRLTDGSVGGLVYSIAEGALRVWRGVADLSTDHLATWKERKERESDRRYEINWPKDDDLRKLLGRVAVPFETANELWGWGTAVEKVVLLRPVQATGAAQGANVGAPVPDAAGEPVPLTAQAIKDGKGKNKRGEWLPEARTLMLEAMNAAKVNGERLEEVAATFGFLSRQAFTAAATRTIKGTRSKAAQTPWPASATSGATR